MVIPTKNPIFPLLYEGQSESACNVVSALFWEKILRKIKRLDKGIFQNKKLTRIPTCTFLLPLVKNVGSIFWKELTYV